MSCGPKPATQWIRRRKGVRMLKREKVWLAVHRHDNSLYYKRLEPEAFKILTAIAGGSPVEDACEKSIAGSERDEIDWAVQIKEWFNAWGALGWFCRRS